MRILVCGGRKYGLKYSANGKRYYDAGVMKYVHLCLWPYANLDEELVIIQGDATGADELGKMWAKANNVECECYPADWDRYKKAAGYRRNAEMLAKGKPELVMAFPGGPGTAMMVKLAKSKQVDVIEL